MKANKFYIAAIAALLFSSAAHAQEFRTNESISEQLKKGTVPGTKISSEIRAKKVQDDTESKQKISVPVKQQLLNGTYPGITVAKSAPVGSRSAAPANKTAMASDNKPVAEKAAKPAEMPVMQEGKKEETTVPAEKKVITKEVPSQGGQMEQ